MKDILEGIRSPLFEGISPQERGTMLGCIGYHIGTFKKGSIVAFEGENLKHIGIVLSGSVDMVKEDLWGNKTMLVRTRKDELFGETFACGEDNLSVVTFQVSENAKILFLPFDRVMHSCTMACRFHHQLIENMVHIIANKNRDLMRKVEVVSKRSIREKLLTYLSIQAQAQERQDCPQGERTQRPLHYLQAITEKRSQAKREVLPASSFKSEIKHWTRHL